MGSVFGLGIDIGTTFTAAAVCHPGERPRPVQLGTSSFAIPSVVFVKPDGDVLVGEAAERAAVADPTRVARHFKRRFGDDTPFVLGGTPVDATTLTTAMLRSVVDQVIDRNGGPPAAITVTHPANWGAFRQEMLGQLTDELGRSVQLLSEPEAAGIEYQAAERVAEGTAIGVYDLGGGTFDAVVLRKQSNGFSMAGKAEGIERLGGVDFDAAIVGFAAQQLGAPVDDDRWERVGHELRRNCIEAKLQLSEDTVADVRMPIGGGVPSVRLTRAEFEELIRPLVVETIRVFARALRQAGIEADELDRILLVGGSSRVPLVGSMLHREFARPVFVDTDPTMTVALGAARHASSDLEATPRQLGRPPERLTPQPAFTELAPQSEIAELVESSGRPSDPPRRAAMAQPPAAMTQPPAAMTQPPAAMTQPPAAMAQRTAVSGRQEPDRDDSPARSRSIFDTPDRPGAVPAPEPSPPEEASDSPLAGLASESPLRDRRSPVTTPGPAAVPLTASPLEPVKQSSLAPLIAAVALTAAAVVLLTQLLT